MRILVMDTSNSSCSAGVYELVDDEIKEISYEISFEKRTHSETFMPLVRRVMTEAKFTHEDLDLYASTVGPGSFTGIRIGLSAVKGMALAADKLCVPVSSTESLALSVDNVQFPKEDTILIPCFDARNNRVFAQVIYDFNKDILIPEDGIDSDILAGKISELEMVKNKDMHFIAIGNGADVMVAAMNKTGLNCENAAGAVIHPKGIMRAAQNYLKNNKPVSGAEITASYCAQSSAERYKK